MLWLLALLARGMGEWENGRMGEWENGGTADAPARQGSHSPILPLILLAALAVPAAGQVKVSLAENLPRAKSPGLILENGAVSYQVVFVPTDAPRTDANAFALKGFGLYPSKRGWSGIGDFLDLLLDGASVFPATFRVSALAPGTRGSATLEGESGKAKIQLVFSTDERGDCLFLQVRVTPLVEVKSVALRLSAHPGEFVKSAAANRYPLGEPDTHLLTALRDVNDAEKIALEPAREPWLFLYDGRYDPARNADLSAEMCACGLLYNPKGVRSVVATRVRGHVQVQIDLPVGRAGEAVTADLALWEFATSNEQGRRTMQSLVLE